jgi:FkbM family methyltransferase
MGRTESEGEAILAGSGGIFGAIRNKINGFREMMGFSNGMVLILDRLIHPGATVSIYRKGKLEIPVFRPGGDIQSIRTCLVGPMYRRWISNLALQGELNVLDLGAHVGGFSLLLQDLGLRLKKLVAVEFNPNTALRLSYNLSLNLGASAEVKVLNVGVSGSDGTYAGDFGLGSSSDSLMDVPGSVASPKVATRQIPLRTVDNIIGAEFGSEIIDLCKMDIEGAEYGVFEQGTEALRRVRFLVMEIHAIPLKDPADIVRAVLNLGFEQSSEDREEHLFLFKNRAIA